jgi:hypothetical protein
MRTTAYGNVQIGWNQALYISFSNTQTVVSLDGYRAPFDKPAYLLYSVGNARHYFDDVALNCIFKAVGICLLRHIEETDTTNVILVTLGMAAFFLVRRIGTYLATKKCLYICRNIACSLASLGARYFAGLPRIATGSLGLNWPNILRARSGGCRLPPH